VSDRSIAALPNQIKLGALVSITAQGSDQVVAVGYLNQSKADLAKHTDKAVITVSNPNLFPDATSARAANGSRPISSTLALITSGSAAVKKITHHTRSWPCPLPPPRLNLLRPLPPPPIQHQTPSPTR